MLKAWVVINWWLLIKIHSASRIEQDSSFWVRISQLGSRFWSTFSTHHPTVSTSARLPGCTSVLPGLPPATEGAILHGGVGEKKNSKQQRGTTKIEQYTAPKQTMTIFSGNMLVVLRGKLLGYFYLDLVTWDNLDKKKCFSLAGPWVISRIYGHLPIFHRSFTRIHQLGWVISWVKL